MAETLAITEKLTPYFKRLAMGRLGSVAILLRIMWGRSDVEEEVMQ
jgi:hypothetical protein